MSFLGAFVIFAVVPATSLVELQSHPSRYHNREVTVVGELDLGRDLGNVQLLRDRSHKMTVILPATIGELSTLLGKRVEIRGKFVDHAISAIRPNDGAWKQYGRFVIWVSDVVEVKTQPATDESESEADPPPPSSRASPPEILSVKPAPGTRGIAVNTVFILRFSRPMDESTLRDHIFLREGDIGEPPASVVEMGFSYHREISTLTLTPSQPLNLLKQLRLTLYRGIADTGGTPLRVERLEPKKLASRRAALNEGVDLDELVVFEFVTRGY